MKIDEDINNDYKINSLFFVFYTLKVLTKLATIAALFLFILNISNLIFGYLLLGLAILTILDSAVEFASGCHDKPFSGVINILRTFFSLFRFVIGIQIFGNSFGLSILPVLSDLNTSALLTIILALYVIHNVLNCIKRPSELSNQSSYVAGSVFALALIGVASWFMFSSPLVSLCILGVASTIFIAGIVLDVKIHTDVNVLSDLPVHEGSGRNCFFSTTKCHKCTKIHEIC